MSFLCVLLVRKVATNLKKTIIAKSEKKNSNIFLRSCFFYCENQFTFANFTFKEKPIFKNTFQSFEASVNPIKIKIVYK